MSGCITPPLKSGVYYDVPSSLYHSPGLTSEEALTASLADKLVNEGPARAWIWRRNQQRKRMEDLSEAKRQQLEFGTAAHVSMLEMERWEEKVVVMPETITDKKTGEVRKVTGYTIKDIRAVRDDARKNNKTPILQHEADAIEHMGLALRNKLPGINFKTATELAVGAFDGGKGEVTIVAGGNGEIYRKIRPDYVRISKDEHMIVDYKATGLRGDNMEREARLRNWPLRSAFYKEAYEEVVGIWPRYVFVVQERVDPFFVYAWEVPKVAEEAGKQEVAESKRIYKHCMETGEWPSDVEGIRYLFDDVDFAEIVV